MNSSIFLARFSSMIHWRMFDCSRFSFVSLSPADYSVNVLLIGTRLFRFQLRLISVMNSITKIERMRRVNPLVRKGNGCVERVSSSTVHPQVVSIDDNDAIGSWIVEIKVMKIHVIDMFPCRIVRVDRRNVSMENLATEKTNRHVVSDRRQIARVFVSRRVSRWDLELSRWFRRAELYCRTMSFQSTSLLSSRESMFSTRELLWVRLNRVGWRSTICLDLVVTASLIVKISLMKNTANNVREHSTSSLVTRNVSRSMSIRRITHSCLS